MDVARLIFHWLLSRGIIPITGTRNPTHMASNLSLQKGACEVTDALPIFTSLFEQRDMVDMMGGSDEYAAAFSAMPEAR